MIAEPIKTVEEYTLDFKNDYELVVNLQYTDTKLIPVEKGQGFEIFTMYTDRTPVTASNSSGLITR